MTELHALLFPARRPLISVVVPLYCEQENLPELYRRLTHCMSSIDASYELIFVNDGSSDATAQLLDDLEHDEHVVGVHLSRNFGHQAAVSAGLELAAGDAIVVMDGDLQDPPEVVPELIERWQLGFDVVYAVRRNRKEHIFKRAAYAAFYRLLRAISEIDIPLDSGDFCVMGRCVVDALNAMPERMRFVRGMRSFVGFRQVGHEYDRAGRGAGKPKYTLASLAGLAIDGLVSFSNFPLRLVTKLGIVAALSALILVLATIVDAIARRSAPHGWASTIVVVLAMGSVQLLSLGIFGEYLRLIFLEAKGRPFYIIARTRARNAAAARQSARQPHDHDMDEGDRRRWNGAGDLARAA